ncbi:MAG: class II aldolase/adducin family protein [Chloroflexi bacterium]|nr:class II aldolase/adducin family protein [Chloroflexota bacterium]
MTHSPPASGAVIVAPTPTVDQLRELVAKACRILYQQGLSDYLGHPSARIPGTDLVVIKPKHSPRVRGMDTMRPEHMVIIDLEGNLVEGEEIPPTERFIHTEIYRARPDVASVVHTHQPQATLAGVIELPILPVLHVAAPLLEQPVPLWPVAELVVDSRLGAELATALGQASLCHLQGHGIVSVAGSVEEATLGAIHLEQLAEVCVKAAQTGRSPRVIPTDQIANLRKRLASPAGRWAYYAELAGAL